MLPLARDYIDAMHSAHDVLFDQALQQATVEFDELGQPKSYSGTFTTTFKLSANEQSYAVRCYVDSIERLAERYSEISQRLSDLDAPAFARFEYQHSGIFVLGSWQPIVKMSWVSGTHLRDWIEANARQNGIVTGLAADFRRLSYELAAASIAHGDLQHGNIVVSDEKIRLIDYDGMYVPALAGGYSAADVGHSNYQHPSRQISDFDDTLDRFSIIVIYIALLTLAAEPILLEHYEDEDALLFTRDDMNGRRSTFENRLAGVNPELHKHFLNLKLLSKPRPLGTIPSLDDFLSGNFRAVIDECIVRTVPQSQPVRENDRGTSSSFESLKDPPRPLIPLANALALLSILVAALVFAALLALRSGVQH